MIHGVETGTTVKEKDKDAVDILMPGTSCSTCIEIVMGGFALRGGYANCVPSQHVTLLLSKRHTASVCVAHPRCGLEKPGCY